MLNAEKMRVNGIMPGKIFMGCLNFIMTCSESTHNFYRAEGRWSESLGFWILRYMSFPRVCVLLWAKFWGFSLLSPWSSCRPKKLRTLPRKRGSSKASAKSQAKSRAGRAGSKEQARVAKRSKQGKYSEVSLAHHRSLGRF